MDDNPPVSLTADSPLYTRGPLFYRILASKFYFSSMTSTFTIPLISMPSLAFT